MTDVAFHFGASDKIAYACRLLRKAVGSGAKVAVLADATLGARLDAALWGLSAIDFVPHCADSASDSLLRHSPVVFITHIQKHGDTTHQVLLQLCQSVPPEVQKYGRVIELVSLDESDRQEARQRWKTYAVWGMPIQKYDLALKEQL